MKTFNDIGLNEDILKSLEERGFERPTPIQAKAIPHLMSSNQDIIASVQTGTGKTATFGLPSIHMTQINEKAPQALVMCPTRELCNNKIVGNGGKNSGGGKSRKKSM